MIKILPTFSVFLECDDKWLIFQTVGFVRCKKKTHVENEVTQGTATKCAQIRQYYWSTLGGDGTGHVQREGFFFLFFFSPFFLWSSMSWYFLWQSTCKSQAFRLEGSVFSGFRNCRTDDERLWWTCEMYVTKSLFRSKKNIKSWNVTFLSVDETLKEKIYIYIKYKSDGKVK